MGTSNNKSPLATEERALFHPLCDLPRSLIPTELPRWSQVEHFSSAEAHSVPLSKPGGKPADQGLRGCSCASGKASQSLKGATSALNQDPSLTQAAGWGRRTGLPRAASEGRPPPAHGQRLQAQRAHHLIFLREKLGALSKFQLLGVFIFYSLCSFASPFLLPLIETSLGEPPSRFRWNKVGVIKRI